MSALLSTANAACDPLFSLLNRAGAWPLLLVVSLLASLMVLVVYRLVARPERIEAARNRLVARVLEIPLFDHDPVVVFTAPLRATVASFSYIRSSFAPLLILIVPLALVVGQLSCWLEHRPLRIGEQAVLTVKFGPSVDLLATELEIETSGAVDAETGALRVPALQEASWRLRAQGDASSHVRIHAGSAGADKSIVVSDRAAKVSSRRVADTWSAMLFPAEPILAADSGMAWIDVAYPPRPLAIGRWNVHWLVAFIILLFAWTLALIKPMRVQL